MFQFFTLLFSKTLMSVAQTMEDVNTVAPIPMAATSVDVMMDWRFPQMDITVLVTSSTDDVSVFRDDYFHLLQILMNVQEHWTSVM